MYNSLYDYIAQNYYKMDREDLKDIILELIFNFSQELTDNKYVRVVKEALKEINEDREEEDKIIIDWE